MAWLGKIEMSSTSKSLDYQAHWINKSTVYLLILKRYHDRRVQKRPHKNDRQ
jgi:hypothetical protein